MDKEIEGKNLRHVCCECHENIIINMNRMLITSLPAYQDDLGNEVN